MSVGAIWMLQGCDGSSWSGGGRCDADGGGANDVLGLVKWRLTDGSDEVLMNHLEGWFWF